MDKRVIGCTMAAILAVLFAFVCYFSSVRDKAIRLEENIAEAHANTQNAEKARYDCLVTLAEAIVSSNEHESTTLKEVVEARQGGTTEDSNEISNAISVMVESYPDLKHSDSYVEYSKAVRTAESAINNARDFENAQVKSYNRYVRSTLAGMYLRNMGYETIETSFTSFEGYQDAPSNLFTN